MESFGVAVEHLVGSVGEEIGAWGGGGEEGVGAREMEMAREEGGEGGGKETEGEEGHGGREGGEMVMVEVRLSGELERFVGTV